MAPSKSSQPFPPSAVRRRAKSLAARLAKLATKETIDLQELVKIRAELIGVERMASGRKRRALQGQGARNVILEYLKENVGRPVFGDELREVSGIQEWARRVRELRTDYGYNIVEEGGSYTLVSKDPSEPRLSGPTEGDTPGNNFQ